VTCRIVKTGDAPDDMMSVRFFSFYDAPTDEDEAEVGGGTCIRCPFEWCNLPELYGGLLAICEQDPVCDGFTGNFRDLPVFVKLSKGTSGGATASSRPMANQALATRLAIDCLDVGLDLTQGAILNGPYGFRRGGTQVLMVETGKADLIMRLGGWTRRSDSFLFYVTNASVRGTLSTTLRSYGQDEITQAAHAAIDAQRSWVTRLVHETVSMLESNDDIEAVRSRLESKGVEFLLESLLDIVGRMRKGPSL